MKKVRFWDLPVGSEFSWIEDGERDDYFKIKDTIKNNIIRILVNAVNDGGRLVFFNGYEEVYIDES